MTIIICATIPAVLCVVLIIKIPLNTIVLAYKCNTDMHVTLSLNTWGCKHVLCVHYNLAHVIAATPTLYFVKSINIKTCISLQHY